MWRNPQFPVDLVTFTEEILKEKLHFLTLGSSRSGELFNPFDTNALFLKHHEQNQKTRDFRF